jgi:hypothetical protein
MEDDTVIKLSKFKSLLEKGIEVREAALFPENPLFSLPIDRNTEVIIEREQAVLKCLLSQFEKMFQGAYYD